MQAKKAIIKAAVESYFVKALFITLALVLLISQIPIWVSPSRALEKGFTKHKPTGLALTQEVLLSVLISIQMVFVSAIALYTAFNPRRLIISVFVFLTAFFFGAAAYEVHNLGGSNSIISALVLNLLFLFLLVVAYIKTPRQEAPEKPHVFVRIFFLIVALVFSLTAAIDIIVPETMLKELTTEMSTDSYHMSQFKILLVVAGFIDIFVAVVALFSCFEPERNVVIVFATLLFAYVVFWAHLIENHVFYSLNYNSLVASEVVNVVLFVFCCVSAYIVPPPTNKHIPLTERV